MSEMEGLQSSVQVALKVVDILEKLLGFSWSLGKGAMAFVGQGFGKSARLVYDIHKNKRMLGGGARTFEEIVRNKGSLDVAITTVHIEDWDSPEGREIEAYLKKRGIQFVLLDDITKGDNRVQFMFHASDAQRVNFLLEDYKKVSFERAKSAAEVYDDLSKERQTEINETFEKGLREEGYDKKMVESLYMQVMYGDMEKKTKAIGMAQDQVRGTYPLENVKELPHEEIWILKDYMKIDKAKDVAFIRGGDTGYVVPLSCVKEVVAGHRGKNDVDIQYICKVEDGASYMEFRNGEINRIKGKELQKKLKGLNAMQPYNDSKQEVREYRKPEEVYKEQGSKEPNQKQKKTTRKSKKREQRA